LKRDN